MNILTGEGLLDFTPEKCGWFSYVTYNNELAFKNKITSVSAHVHVYVPDSPSSRVMVEQKGHVTP